MEYRRLPHGDEQFSVIGLGTSSLGESDEAEIISVIEQAMQNGINYIDLAVKSPHAASWRDDLIGITVNQQHWTGYLSNTCFQLLYTFHKCRIE